MSQPSIFMWNPCIVPNNLKRPAEFNLFQWTNDNLQVGPFSLNKNFPRENTKWDGQQFLKKKNPSLYDQFWGRKLVLVGKIQFQVTFILWLKIQKCLKNIENVNFWNFFQPFSFPHRNPFFLKNHHFLYFPNIFGFWTKK